MFEKLTFIREQFQQYGDTDPTTAFQNAGLIMFDDVPVFYARFPDHFLLDIEGIQLKVPRS